MSDVVDVPVEETPAARRVERGRYLFFPMAIAGLVAPSRGAVCPDHESGCPRKLSGVLLGRIVRTRDHNVQLELRGSQ